MKIIPMITDLNATRLFWATLEPYRETQHYEMLRRKIAELVARKAEGKPAPGRDARFNRKSGGPLEGIWHCAISRNPDVVLFYTMDEGALNLAMLGTHHDYPSDGKNRRAAARTAGRIHNALRKGFFFSPWDRLDWRDVDRLLESTELYEASTEALDTLYRELMEELDTGACLARKYGTDDIYSIPEADFVTHFDKVALLQEKCHEIMRMQPMTSSDYLRLVRDTWKSQQKVGEEAELSVPTI